MFSLFKENLFYTNCPQCLLGALMIIQLPQILLEVFIEYIPYPISTNFGIPIFLGQKTTIILKYIFDSMSYPQEILVYYKCTCNSQDYVTNTFHVIWCSNNPSCFFSPQIIDIGKFCNNLHFTVSPKYIMKRMLFFTNMS